MSYELIGRFKDENGNVIHVTNLGILKTINELKYSVSLKNVESNDKGLFEYESFNNAYGIFFKNYLETKEKVEKLEQIRFSMEFYKNKNDDLDEDIREYEDIMRNNKYAFESCLMMCGMFEMLSTIVTDDDCVERKVFLEITAE